ncbi:MAG: hypothetical protein HXY50_13855 [Ignavibacteriaceae bacterium]|nr:hypothetical protein [Ignavibacteriaceae bacterium]
MSQLKSKIIGLILFITIISVLFIIALKPVTKQSSDGVKSLTLSGNQLLSQSSYLNFAKLNQEQNFRSITLELVKDRLDKHPFIVSTEVEQSNQGSVKVEMLEKELIAFLILRDESYLLSNELQMLPILTNTKISDLPIINNPKNASDYKVLSYLESEEILEAYSILKAIKYLNPNMLSRLSEINLNHGNDITLTFSGIKPLIKFGKNEVAKKILVLNSLWKELENKDSDLGQSEYVDLRFTNQIYFAKAVETEL